MSRTRPAHTVLFLGVRTRGSQAHSLFPLWMKELQLDIGLRGIDLPLNANRHEYRLLVDDIAGDETVLGAVITSHKLSLFQAAGDSFAILDRFATVAGELNAIWKTEHGLAGGARDPIAVRTCLAAMLDTGHWQRHDADIVCLGAGGAATAIALGVLAVTSPDGSLRAAETGPRRFVFTDVRQDRLDALGTTLAALGPLPTQLELQLASAVESDTLLDLPPHSLLINASGLGKDAPGSPLDRTAVFPGQAVVWELNYRGERPFLAHARAQEQRKHLSIHDGWLYFLTGWLEALRPILNLAPDTRLEGPAAAQR